MHVVRCGAVLQHFRCAGLQARYCLVGADVVHACRVDGVRRVRHGIVFNKPRCMCIDLNLENSELYLERKVWVCVCARAYVCVHADDGALYT